MLSIWLEVVAVLLRILFEECLAPSRAEVQRANALVIHWRTQRILCRALIYEHPAHRIAGHIGVVRLPASLAFGSNAFCIDCSCPLN